MTNSAGDTFQLPVTITVYDSYVQNSAPQIELTNYLIYIGKGEDIDPLDYLKSVKYHNLQYALTDDGGTFAVDTTGWGTSALKEFKEREPMVSRKLFSVNNLVNNIVPGTYEIRYSLTDLEGNTGEVSLIVIVEEEA